MSPPNTFFRILRLVQVIFSHFDVLNSLFSQKNYIALSHCALLVHVFSSLGLTFGSFPADSHSPFNLPRYFWPGRQVMTMSLFSGLLDFCETLFPEPTSTNAEEGVEETHKLRTSEAARHWKTSEARNERTLTRTTLALYHLLRPYAVLTSFKTPLESITPSLFR